MKFYLVLITLLISLFMNGCSSDSSPFDVKGIAKVVIAPQSVLLTNPNQSKMLSATAYDSNGNILDKKISWTSSHSDIVAIAVDGNASAQGIIGSTTITAEVDGVKSAPVMMLVTEIVGGAIQISDEQVKSDITLVDPTHPVDIGTQYKVTLSGIVQPQDGDMIIGTGEMPVGGRVVTSTITPDGIEVILELVTLDNLFMQLKIDESMDLSKVEPVIDANVSNYYTMQENADGSLSFIPIVTFTAAVYREFDIGPFECKIEGTGNIPPFSFSNPVTDIHLERNIGLDFIYDASHGGLQKAAITGEIEGKYKAKPELTEALAAKISCGHDFFSIPMPPLPGVIGAVLGFEIPVGIGFELGGQIQFRSTTISIDAHVHYLAEAGIQCDEFAGCSSLHSLTDDHSGLDINLSTQYPEDGVRIKPELSGYISAKLAARIGLRCPPPWRCTGASTTFELVEAKAGLKQGADLAELYAQAEYDNYASEYKLSIFATVGAGADINNYLSRLGLSGSIFEYQFPEILLATSPKVTKATADQETYSVGDIVTFKVELDPNTVDYSFLGYNVDKISIYRRIPDGQGDFEYNLFFEMPAVDGQTRFERDWVFTEDGNITDNYFAFIETKWLPTFAEFGVLELAPIVEEPEDYTTTRECTEGGVTDRWSWEYIVDENKTIADYNGAITTYVTSEQNLTATKYIHTTQITHPDNTVTYKNETYDTALPIINPLRDNIGWDFKDYVYAPRYIEIPKYLLTDGSTTYEYINGKVTKTLTGDPDYSEEFFYDTSFNIIKQVNHNNGYTHTYEYAYDSANNVILYKDIRDTCTNTTTVSYQYDSFGNITGLDNSTDVVCSDYIETQDMIFTYDNHNNMISQRITYVEDTAEAQDHTFYGTRIVNYTYDSLENILSKIRSEGDASEVFPALDSSESYSYMPGTHHMVTSVIKEGTNPTKDCSYSDTRW